MKLILGIAGRINSQLTLRVLVMGTLAATSAAADAQSLGSIEPQSAWARVVQGEALLIDVREQITDPGIAVGAIHAPPTTISSLAGRIEAGISLIVYADGPVPPKTLHVLRDMHTGTIAVLAGGIDAWVAAALPVSGVRPSAPPPTTPSFDRLLSRDVDFAPAMLLVHRSSSRHARDALADLREWGGFSVPTAIVEIPEVGDARVHEEGPRNDRSGLRTLADDLIDDVVDNEFSQPTLVAVGLPAEGAPLFVVYGAATRVAALQRLIRRPLVERAPRIVVRDLLRDLYVRTNLSAPAREAYIAFFSSACTDCGAGPLHAAIRTTSRAAGVPWLVFLPNSAQGFHDLLRKTAGDSLTVVGYDDFDTQTNILLAQLSVLRITTPIFLAPGAISQ